MQKRNPAVGYITVVFTYVHLAGYPKGTILYRAMNDIPFHPLGFGQWGECQPGMRFIPGGSKVSFSDLPSECRELILQDYKDLWDCK